MDACPGLIDRNIYPEDGFPVGQWEYRRFREENFAAAIARFGANPMKALFRGGGPAGINLAQTRRDHCRNLTIRVVPSGHWMAQEKPAEVNDALVNRLAGESLKAPEVWAKASAPLPH